GLAQAPASGQLMVALAETFETGNFVIYLPPDVPAVRGILLALGGPDTRAFVAKGSFGAPAPELEASLHILGQELRALAAEQQLAIMGTSLHGLAPLPNEPQTDALIFTAIAEGAELSGHRELTDTPIFLYGISGGAQQAAGFTTRNPGRVAALILKAPETLVSLSSAKALAVPTYLILGQCDAIADNNALVAAFESNRRAGGLWALAVQADVPHHSLTQSQRAITVHWLRTLAKLRLGALPQDALPVIPESSGWLGHSEMGVSSWADYPGDRKAASWFASQATAEEWWKFAGQTALHDLSGCETRTAAQSD
ncbi:MAG TPA: hypothetical protein VKN35_16000, partial [Xanthomonadales bacterium]|nr:hypothetical protein [Xanthomonadales bacterium]